MGLPDILILLQLNYSFSVDVYDALFSVLGSPKLVACQVNSVFDCKHFVYTLPCWQPITFKILNYLLKDKKDLKSSSARFERSVLIIHLPSCILHIIVMAYFSVLAFRLFFFSATFLQSLLVAKSTVLDSSLSIAVIIMQLSFQVCLLLRQCLIMTLH